MSERVFILIFHGVGEPPHALEPGEERVWVSRDSLCSVLDAVVGRPDIRLTFDDANRSDHEHALPELVARGLTATFFIVADRIDQPGFLTTTMLHEMREAGMSLQSHGKRHRIWRGLDREALAEELHVAREVLQETIQQPVQDAAIPFCLYDRRVLAALRQAGYRHVYSCDGGSADPRAWLQARNEIARGDDERRLAQITHPRMRRRLEIALKAPIKRWR